MNSLWSFSRTALKDSLFRWNGGRLGRGQFWSVLALWWFVFLVATVVISDENWQPSIAFGATAWGLLGYYHFWIGGIRRLRDAGRSPWWMLFFPYAMWLMMEPTAGLESDLIRAGMPPSLAKLEAQKIGREERQRIETT